MAGGQASARPLVAPGTGLPSPPGPLSGSALVWFAEAELSRNELKHFSHKKDENTLQLF